MTGALAARPRLATLMLLAGIIVLGEIRAAASEVFTDAPVPGGAIALARLADLPAVPERGRVLIELTRLLYDSEGPKNAQVDPRLARLAAHVISVRETTLPRTSAGPALPDDTVPVPLTPAIWSAAILHRPVSLETLLPTVLLDRRAALLAHGLFALDDETLTFLAARPQLLHRLYEHAGAFSVFGESLRIEAGRIAVPGDVGADDLWTAVVGESPADPDRFVHQLFSRHEGRVAYLFHALSRMDRARVAFALGLWLDDAERRRDRFKTLVDTLSAYPGLEFDIRPFSRPTEDIVLLIARLQVAADGKPTFPPWRRFWQRVFESIDVPGDRARLAKDIREDGVVDAAWLSEALTKADFRFRAERLDQIAFAQRVFSAIEDDQLEDAIASLRAFPAARMLMLTLEHIGVRAPVMYAVAARRARELSSLDADRGFVALTQFQASIVVIDRLVSVDAMDARTAAALVSRLVALPLIDGRYGGAVARWLRDDLRVAVRASGDDVDAWLVQSLAGPAPAGDSRRVVWEDEAYRIDLAAPERRRLKRALHSTDVAPLSQAMAMADSMDALTSRRASLADVRSTADRLTAAATDVDARLGGSGWLPPGVSAGRDQRETLHHVANELGRVRSARDLPAAAQAAQALGAVIDARLADGLRALVYGLSDGDDDSQSLRLAAVSGRHDFGFEAPRADVRVRTAWAEPVESVAARVPWHVTGSLLGLDLGLSLQTLRTLTVNAAPTVPMLSSNEARSFARTVALLNPRDLRDSDLDVLLDSVRRGRERLAASANRADLSRALVAVGVDGWRRRLVQQSLAGESVRAASYLSMTELLALGQRDAATPLPDTWGVSSGDFDGCSCTRLPMRPLWTVVIGRAKTGILATQVADLNLTVAARLRELGLPAALLKGVLAVALRDFLDRVNPLHPYDWMTLVQEAQQITADRVTDIVASLTAFGPLVPDEQPPVREDRP